MGKSSTGEAAHEEFVPLKRGLEESGRWKHGEGGREEGGRGGESGGGMGGKEKKREEE